MPRPLEFDRTKALEKAIRVFWEKGYEATSLDDLTAAMQIRRSSLYNSFGDKRSLYLEALKHYQEVSSAQMMAVFDHSPNILEGFRQMFRDVIHGQDACFGCMIVSAGNEFADTDEAVSILGRDAAEQSEAGFKKLLHQAQQNKELNHDVDIDEHAAFLYNTLVGLRTQARSGVAEDKLERVKDAALKVLEHP